MYYIGIDLGGTNIAGGVVDDKGKIIVKSSRPTLFENGPQQIKEGMHALALELTAQAGLTPDDIAGIGIGTPGIIRKSDGRIIVSSNLPFDETPVLDSFLPEFTCPAYLENDANAAALGEATSGAAAGCSSSLMVTLGTGVGGGIVIGGRVYSGINDAAGEIGHTVIVYGGKKCGSGRRGCWEQYASVNALVAQTKEAMQAHPESSMHAWCQRNGEVNGRTAFDEAKRGDETAKAVVEQYIEYVGCGLVNMVHIFQCEVIVIGGGISKEGDYLLKPLIHIVERDRYTKNCVQTEIRQAQLGNDAGIIGAAMTGKGL